MAKKVGVDLSNLFSGAEYSQEVHELKETIDKLQEEITQLRSTGNQELETKIQELRGHLASSGVQDVAIEVIDPNPEQPRQTFSEESITAIALSLQSEGQQEPVILIKQINERYLLFDGERRWRGAKQLNWVTLKAVVIPQTEALHRRVLLANLHRENLNSLDIAEALIKEIAAQSDFKGEEIPRILRTGVRRLERQGSMTQVSELVLATREQQQQQLLTLGLGDAEQIVFRVLLSLLLNPASVNANIFPMLTLPNDLKQAIREQGLGGIHALALARLSAKTLDITEAAARKVRTRILKQVLQEKLSVAQSRQIIAAEIARHTKQPDSNSEKKQVDTIIRRVQEIHVLHVERPQLIQMREALQQKLIEIESALKQSDNPEA
ncbi:ParB/RepB/Spo0J family partition protein [Komarekiella sp. 'clone 1']|uniref:ParB/RepB/Spo0J family partition protein n=1 Tax=Komarekiella delphini-convector SJRDD-AB1 TaxID=2593771 RepID=A0AA41BA63_9NOST|nr:ParB/RepB/Spo0J family partition protein [Komarekiella delphini-convector]MBD6620997.1 ParB/RepB/Spo0J family partition protein [Komarekiella delphini-convector SJRDD-AB1]